MRPHEVIEGLRVYAHASVKAAEIATDAAGRARLNFMAAVMLDAADTILQLQDRLVRQACSIEHIEAAAEPKSWPLLEDDDCGGAL